MAESELDCELRKLPKPAGIADAAEFSADQFRQAFGNIAAAFRPVAEREDVLQAMRRVAAIQAVAASQYGRETEPRAKEASR